MCNSFRQVLTDWANGVSSHTHLRGLLAVDRLKNTAELPLRGTRQDTRVELEKRSREARPCSHQLQAWRALINALQPLAAEANPASLRARALRTAAAFGVQRVPGLIFGPLAQALDGA